MYVGPCCTSEALEEIRDQLRLQVAHQARANLGFDYRGRAAAEVHSDDSKCLVHGHDEVACAHDPTAVPQRAIKCLTKRDAGVFYRVVLVDIQITGCGQVQVETPMPRKQFQHVVEKADPSGDGISTAAFEHQSHADIGFRCSALDLGPPHALAPCFATNCGATSRRTVMSCVVCASVPMVMRTQPSQPASALRSRTRMPRLLSASTNWRGRSPAWTSMKFAWLGQ